MKDIDILLENYKAGSPENKPDVIKQINTIKETREKMIQEQAQKQQEYNGFINSMTNASSTPQVAQNTMDNYIHMIQELSSENHQLKDKIKYLEDKITKLITDQIQLKRETINIL